MEAIPTVDLVLEPMTPEEFEDFKGQTIRNYAEENVSAGYWTSSEAMKRSIETHEKLLPNGVATEGHHIFTARDSRSRERVGYIWLSVERNVAIPSGFIFSVLIYEQFRGRGYGTKMMSAVEAKASGLGLRRLGLHVFAQNPLAIHLYQKGGFRVTSVNMMKDLTPE